MKVKELRIGNYVAYHGEIREISSLHSDNTLRLKEEVSSIGCFRANSGAIDAIPLTEDVLLKFGFENWGKGKLYATEYETYDRYVLHNVINGTSNFELHFIKATHGGTDDYYYVVSCDEDERIDFGAEIESAHQLQNLYYALTGQELTFKTK